MALVQINRVIAKFADVPVVAWVKGGVSVQVMRVHVIGHVVIDDQSVRPTAGHINDASDRADVVADEVV